MSCGKKHKGKGTGKKPKMTPSEYKTLEREAFNGLKEALLRTFP